MLDVRAAKSEKIWGKNLLAEHCTLLKSSGMSSCVLAICATTVGPKNKGHIRKCLQGWNQERAYQRKKTIYIHLKQTESCISKFRKPVIPSVTMQSFLFKEALLASVAVVNCDSLASLESMTQDLRKSRTSQRSFAMLVFSKGLCPCDYRHKQPCCTLGPVLIHIQNTLDLKR